MRPGDTASGRSFSTGVVPCDGTGRCVRVRPAVIQLTNDAWEPGSDEAQAAAVEWGRDKARFWLGALDRHLLGGDKKFLCGNELTIADYFGAGILSIGEVTHCDFAQYPNVARWYASMKSRPNWAKANEAFTGMVASTKDASFVTV